MDLAAGAGADQHHRQPRRAPDAGGEVLHVMDDTVARSCGMCFAVDDRARGRTLPRGGFGHHNARSI
ncbi:hypothetical protein [Paracoccus beibuensis]|uniref:hypothetical protein n=1 Tax=Paracoccus beibuensis TaxID=547602 RepID=UPI00223ED611|nr:hypothetical protein [Paracoccus beibuensis]